MIEKEDSLKIFYSNFSLIKFKYIIFGFILFSIFFYSYSREFTEPDELKYVEISREMLETGNFLYPLYNYDLYLHKGPLYFYILIIFQKIFGENKFSFIFPSQIFSILILIIFYKFLKLFKVEEEEILLSV
ncbi:MAG: glycosyltransferase family 39 protein [Thermoanaerobaculia bacterium]